MLLQARQYSKTKNVEVKLSYFFDNFTLCLTLAPADNDQDADAGTDAPRASLINFKFGLKADNKHRPQ